MKPILKFEEITIKGSALEDQSSVPELLGGEIIQNGLVFHLDEEDEIYEGYGRVRSAHPYRQYDRYGRKLELVGYKTAVLENDFIRAVFLPELGGRLWSLTDKKKNRNLLYTNDCIRFSNLAVRNAWFSGGVEWNMGIIGHTPFTADRLFTARLTDKDGNPVLRMYEYERIRQAEYQMDFWLEEQSAYLNCRMRIVNSSKEVKPMYWWSNMAVPEYPGGRIIVPAYKAYTSDMSDVLKTDVPIVNGRDISYYGNIPKQVDYFFEIPKEMPKYIAHVDEEGYGLLHLSTERLQSRKLFSWGNNEASGRWQEFLTDHGGRYLEIQAGLGKTQYGCIPMAPHTAWEWMEQYGPVQLSKETAASSYETLMDSMTDYVNSEIHIRDLENALDKSKGMSRKTAEILLTGSTNGALKNRCRQEEREKSLSAHLDYGNYQGELSDFLETGIFPEPEPEDIPKDFISEEFLYQKLKDSIETANRDNWYARYQLGVWYFWRKHYGRALEEFAHSLELKTNAWAYHGLASCYLQENENRKAADTIVKGIFLRQNDLSYLKAGFKMLLLAKDYHGLLKQYELLAENFRHDSRLYFDYLEALYYSGEAEKAYSLLHAEEEFELDDLRECDDSVGKLWENLEIELFGECKQIPHRYQFNAL